MLMMMGMCGGDKEIEIWCTRVTAANTIESKVSGDVNDDGEAHHGRSMTRADECNQCDGTDVDGVPVHSTDLPLPPDEPVHRPQGPQSLQLEGRGMQLRAVMRNTMEAKHMCWERVGVTRTPDACQNSPDTCQNASRNAQCMVRRTISHVRLQASPAQCCIGQEYRVCALALADSKTIPDCDLLHCLGTN